MNPEYEQPPVIRSAIQAWHIVLLALLAFACFCAFKITGFFRLGSETAALRTCVAACVPGSVDKKIALRVGSFTTGLVRFGSRFFSMPPEPRAACESLQAAECGVYRLKEELSPEAIGRLFATTEKTMVKRGWTRLVGVTQGNELVQVYVPTKKLSASSARCCVMVLHQRELVLVSARASLAPLLDLAHENFKLSKELDELGRDRNRVREWVNASLPRHLAR